MANTSAISQQATHTAYYHLRATQQEPPKQKKPQLFTKSWEFSVYFLGKKIMRMDH